MMPCNWSGCSNWAQWVATYPNKSRRALCAGHKQILEQTDKEQHLLPEDQIKFQFVGAIPDGTKVA